MRQSFTPPPAIPAKKSLEELGFTTTITKGSTRRLFVCSAGLERRGKSKFGLSMPGPIGCLVSDPGFWDTAQQVTDRELIVKEFPPIAKPVLGGGLPDATACRDRWEAMRESFASLLVPGRVRSIFVDVCTDWWEAVRMARLNGASMVKTTRNERGEIWGPIKEEFRAVFWDVYNTEVNVVLAHRMAAEYVNDSRTGNFERKGFAEIGYIAQIDIEHYRTDNGQFGIKIKDCRQKADLAGMELGGDDWGGSEMCSFPELAKLVFPESDDSDWK